MGWGEQVLLEVDRCRFGVSDRAFVSRAIVVMGESGMQQQKQERFNNNKKQKTKTRGKMREGRKRRETPTRAHYVYI